MHLRSLAFLLLTACAAASAQAAICRAAPTASGSADGSTWADTMTLQAALGNGGCDEIWLKQGLYKPGTQRDATFAINRPVQLYGGFVGGETARGQRGTNSRLTVLSGDIDGNDSADANGIVLDASDQSGANSYNVVYLRINSANPALTRANTVIDGLTITAGQADGGSGNSGGGGLRCNAQDGACSPTLRNLTFSGNYASSGGALFNSGYNGEASPLISHATFTGNVSGGSGGAIYNSVSGTGSSSPRIEQSTFSVNRATGGGGAGGGAIFNTSPTQLDVAFSTFYGNTATNRGGAIANSGSAHATITASVFWGNTTGSLGAQIFLDGNSGTTVLDGNLVQGGCGGVYAVPNAVCSGNPLTGDPLLGTLQDHGGPTWTMLPGTGSPALGAATCGAGETDQRGVTRPTGACAMGAVEPQATALDIPSSLSASTNQARQITLTWDASNGAVNYEVMEGATMVCRTSATTCVVMGLANGATHSYTVTAINDAGSSSASAAQQGTTLALPDTPTGFTTSGAEVRQATLSWTAPATGGAVERYIVTNTATNAVVCNVPATSTSCVVGSLANGTAYSFALLARNAAGDSSTASTSATTVALPDAPASVTATAGQGSATISWTAPASDGGSAITHYSVSGSPAGTCAPGLALTCTITGLAYGVPHTFTVTATNAAGTGAGASAVATPYAPPPPPTELYVGGPGTHTITDPSLPVVVGPGADGAVLVLPGSGTTPVPFTAIVSGQALEVRALPGTQLQVARVNGQSVLVLVVLQGWAELTATNPNQPMVLAGNVLLRSAVAGTKIEGVPLATGVLAGSLLPPSGAVPQLNDRGLLAGERLHVDAQGAITLVALGTVTPSTRVGNAAPLPNLGEHTTLAAPLAQLQGPVTRLGAQTWLQVLQAQADGAVWTAEGGVQLQLGEWTVPLWAQSPVRIDVRQPDGTTLTPEGLVQVVRKGLVLTLAPTLANWPGFIQALDAPVHVSTEGVLTITLQNQTWVFRPALLAEANSSAGFSADAQGMIHFGGQRLLPAFADYAAARALLQQALQDAQVNALLHPEGALDVQLPDGSHWLLQPDALLADPAQQPGKPWWLGSDGALYLRLGDVVQRVQVLPAPH